MNKYVFITGTSRGLGYGLAKAFLKDYHVIGLSRNVGNITDPNYEHIVFDLNEISLIPIKLEDFFQAKKNKIHVELLILNSGVFGNISDIYYTSLETIEYVFNINVWANKVLLDTFVRLEEKGIIQGPERILGISSGASQSLQRGWSAYALSKAALNSLLKLYSEEMPQKKLISLAPGLVHTQMQDFIFHSKIDLEKYPSFKRILDARGTESMPDPYAVGEKIKNSIEKIFSYPSGSYIDIRKL